MYSEQDLSDAIDAGVMPAPSVEAFRAWMAERRAAPVQDEEAFRLVTGFNDIFVAIAGIVLLSATGSLLAFAGPLAPAAVAAVAWGLAEYFTRRRRMALPSILFLGAFAIGVFMAVFALAEPVLPRSADGAPALAAALAALATVVGCVLHWRRFAVPITIAAGIGALILAVVGSIVAALDLSVATLTPLLALAGLASFALAMRWDGSDVARRTRRSDVAFWLHLLSAPLIVHPLFTYVGLFSDEAGVGAALVAVAAYVLFAVVALVIDRRALMVSALAYVLYAIAALLQAGGLGTSFALTGVLIGSALLLLSALWQVLRRPLVARLPAGWAARVPPAAGPIVHPIRSA